MTVVFNVYVVRDIEKYLGWLSTAILYIGSGLGGNIVSALFVPYSPEVRRSCDRSCDCHMTSSINCIIL